MLNVGRLCWLPELWFVGQQQTRILSRCVGLSCRFLCHGLYCKMLISAVSEWVRSGLCAAHAQVLNETSTRVCCSIGTWSRSVGSLMLLLSYGYSGFCRNLMFSATGLRKLITRTPERKWDCFVPSSDLLFIIVQKPKRSTCCGISVFKIQPEPDFLDLHFNIT